MATATSDPKAGHYANPDVHASELDLVDLPKTIGLTIDEYEADMPRRKASTGSLGWGANEKVVIGGRVCMVSVNVTVVGTKPKAAKGE